MKKVLYLLRHAKSSWADAAAADHQRPLNARGREACRLLARHMDERGIRPARVLCSSSARTRETLQRISAELDWMPSVEFVDMLYLAPVRVVLREIGARGGGAPSLMVIGHNPGLEELAERLVGKGRIELRTDLARKFPTGALAAIGFDIHDWREIAPGAGTLEHFVVPAQLTLS